VRKYPSYKKILREVKKVMKISLVHTNGKKKCSFESGEDFLCALFLQQFEEEEVLIEKWLQAGRRSLARV
jgi:hypothetical protein